MKIETSRLTGPALDWAVAQVTGIELDIIGDHVGIRGRTPDGWPAKYAPSTDWSQGGPLLGEHATHMEKHPMARGEPWVVWAAEDRHGECGDTLLIAAMRAIVAVRLGDAVDVPDGLCQRRPIHCKGEIR